MTETLTGKQVLALLALLAQDEVPEIEASLPYGKWAPCYVTRSVATSLDPNWKFRIKPKPQRRLSVTLANGEVVSWPEPVREELKYGDRYWFVAADGVVEDCEWTDHSVDKKHLAFGNIHLTKEAAQEHADALRRINTQEAGK